MSIPHAFEYHTNTSAWHQKDKDPSEYMHFNVYKHMLLSDCSSSFENTFLNDETVKKIL